MIFFEKFIRIYRSSGRINFKKYCLSLFMYNRSSFHRVTRTCVETAPKFDTCSLRWLNQTIDRSICNNSRTSDSFTVCMRQWKELEYFEFLHRVHRFVFEIVLLARPIPSYKLSTKRKQCSSSICHDLCSTFFW